MDAGQKYAEVTLAMANALAVFILDTKLHNWLRANDPKALEQAIKALDEYGYEKHRQPKPAAVDPTYIDITPDSMKTPEGIKRVTNAQREWDDATHALASEVREAFKYGTLQVDGRTNNVVTKQIKALLATRDQKQEAFFRAVSGR